jgi:hypothetical protein
MRGTICQRRPKRSISNLPAIAVHQHDERAGRFSTSSQGPQERSGTSSRPAWKLSQAPSDRSTSRPIR